jgi:ribose-phosphate pyrophosphokinase
MNTLVFGLPGNEALAARLSAVSGCSAGDCVFRRFPDGETYLRFLTPVRHRRVVLVCTLDQPDEKLLRVYLAARTLRALGAERVLLVAPYLPYMRQDTVFAPGEGISAQYVADLLSGWVDALITVDPHLHRVQKLEQIYRIPHRVVPAAPAIAAWLRTQVREPVLIGPDEESMQWVADIARRLDCPYRTLRKRRYGDRSVSVDPGALSFPVGLTPVLVDDIVSSGGTVLESLKVLATQRLSAPICVAVHGLFVGDALDSIRRAGAVRVVACNTVPHQTECISVDGDIATALSDLLRQAH